MQNEFDSSESLLDPGSPEPEPRHIRVLVVDDHDAVRAGLIFWLASQSDMEVVGQAADGLEAVRLTRELNPDIVIMDIVMPGLDGIEATRMIAREMPAVTVIATSVDDSGPVINAVTKAGAAAFLPKYKSPELLMTALRKYQQAAA
jgi:DNA-binding NarL/FixJ family response regulator